MVKHFFKMLLYFDYNASTPVHPEALGAMLPYFTEDFANPSSANHQMGWRAEAAVENAREQMAAELNCRPNELLFTCGATESNNWVIKNIILPYLLSDKKGPAPHIVAGPIEHSSLRAPLQWAASCGARVDYAKCDSLGRVEPASVENLIRPETQLVTLMWVNNEIGTINPLAEVAKVCRQRQVHFHSDLTQGVGKLNTAELMPHLDLASLSAHKFYGPKGIGLLFRRRKNPKVQLLPWNYGGGQEFGLRSGTLNVPAIIGMHSALKFCTKQAQSQLQKLTQIQNLLHQRILEEFPMASLNGPALGERAPHNLNFCFRNCYVPPQIPGLAISRGSACSSGKEFASPVLTTIGLSEAESMRSLRFSYGWKTEISEVEKVIDLLRQNITT